jgi:hypothetical protein
MRLSILCGVCLITRKNVTLYRNRQWRSIKKSSLRFAVRSCFLPPRFYNRNLCCCLRRFLHCKLWIKLSVHLREKKWNEMWFYRFTKHESGAGRRKLSPPRIESRKKRIIWSKSPLLLVVNWVSRYFVRHFLNVVGFYAFFRFYIIWSPPIIIIYWLEIQASWF